MCVERIGIGVIGGGKAGQNLAQAIRASSLAEVFMFCTRHKKTAQEAAKICGVPRWTTDYNIMLSDKRIDAVIVASPDEFHCEHAVMAARAKKHVLCEKPMCRTLAEADLMINEAKTNNIILMIGFTERFNHQCLEAKKAIDAGKIGVPRMILARRCHSRSVVRRRRWLNDIHTGGVLNYVGTHNIDLICWFMGSSPERIYAEMGQLVLKKQNFTDCAVMTLKFHNNSMATLYETFAYPQKYPHEVDRSIEILGDKGVIHIDFMAQPLNIFTDSSHKINDSVTRPVSERGMAGALLAEAEHFIQCIKEKKTPITTGKTGKQAIQIALAARKAACSGKAVLL